MSRIVHLSKLACLLPLLGAVRSLPPSDAGPTANRRGSPAGYWWLESASCSIPSEIECRTLLAWDRGLRVSIQLRHDTVVVTNESPVQGQMIGHPLRADTVALKSATATALPRSCGFAVRKYPWTRVAGPGNTGNNGRRQAFPPGPFVLDLDTWDTCVAAPGLRRTMRWVSRDSGTVVATEFFRRSADAQ